MIERRALPFSLIVRAMFKTELGLDCRMGATYGNAYCGVVGAIRRHEYAVLGPSVNLAARLMAHPLNRGFLVDEEVRKRAGNSRLFEALEPVMAKGYDDPVPIFVPTRSHQRVNWQDLRDGFVGRENEMEEILSFAKLFMSGGNDEASMLVVSAEEGAGKSSLLAKCTEEMSDLYHGRGLSCCVSIQSFDEGSAMVCFR